MIEDPGTDADLQTVYKWLKARPIDRQLTVAVDDAVQYVLDGGRTWRFDLNSPEVDSDERASVGTKLQYRILSTLELLKEGPLDTKIQGIPVELKGTVRNTWMIPREGQCEICLLVQVDTNNDRHRAFLMRTHRHWLNAPNQDKKRSVRAGARDAYALPVIGWTPLPTNPLKLLTPTQKDAVFQLKAGLVKRLTALFGFLPDTVIPRTAILTVGANMDDPLRRAREAKGPVLAQHGLRVLCGTWTDQAVEAAARGYDLSGEAWIALSPGSLGSPGTPGSPRSLGSPGTPGSGHGGQNLLGDGPREAAGDSVPDLLSDLGFGAHP